MNTIHFYSPKGGTGCSTVASAWAHTASQEGQRVLYIDRTRDYAPLNGVVGDLDVYSGGSSITVVNCADTQIDSTLFDLVIVDHGTIDSDIVDTDSTRIMVTTPCYLSMYRAIKNDLKPDAIILTFPEGRALQEQDIVNTVGSKCIGIMSTDPSVARAIDAGLFSSRLPARLADMVRAAQGKLATLPV